MKIVLLTLFTLASTLIYAQVTPGSPNNFITEWNTLGATSITIPTTGGGYNYDLYWEEIGNPGNNGDLLNQTGNATITGLTAGADYRVEIAGAFPRFFMNNDAGQRDKLSLVTQWGSISWTNMDDSFYGCSNLDVTSTDVPDLSIVFGLWNMFRGCSSLEGVGANWSWNTGNIVNMRFVLLEQHYSMEI